MLIYSRNNLAADRQKGFTLVELAIVLVIIGLLVTGVMQGQELVKQAGVNKTLTGITQLSTAKNAFYAKFKALPGDLAKANVYGVDRTAPAASPNVSAVAYTSNNNGNQDGTLNSANLVTAHNFYSGEIANFMVHLSNSKLLKFTYNGTAGCDNTTCRGRPDVDYPGMPLGNGIVAVTAGKKIHYILGVNNDTAATLNFSDAWDGTGNLTPEEAFQIDAKMDDGKPLAGTIRPITSYGTSSDSFSYQTAQNCVLTNDYELTTETKTCGLAIREK